MINIVLQEHIAIAVALFLTFIFIAYPFIHIFKVRPKLRTFSLRLFITSTIIVVSFLVFYLYMNYLSLEWTYMLPNGTLVTVPHSDWYVSILPTIRIALGVSVIWSVFTLSALLLFDIVRFLREIVRGR